MTLRNWPLCLAILAAWQLPADRARAQDGGAPSDAAVTHAANPLGDVPIAAFTHFLDRPLFVASRRNTVVPPAVAAAPVAPPPAAAPSAANLRLLGTIATATGVSAMIHDTGSGQTRTVARGAAIDRWRMAEIQASKVRLEADGRSVWLEIFGPTTPTTASASGVPATTPNSVPSVPPPASIVAVPPPGTGGDAPPGTVAGTAAAEAARRSPYRLTFGTVEPKPAD